jgi:hypothetical protein
VAKFNRLLEFDAMSFGNHEVLYSVHLENSTLYRCRVQRKTWRMGPNARVDYNLTLCPLQSRLQQIYHGQPYARVDLHPMPESTLSPSQRLVLSSHGILQFSWMFPNKVVPKFSARLQHQRFFLPLSDLSSEDDIQRILAI